MKKLFLQMIVLAGTVMYSCAQPGGYVICGTVARGNPTVFLAAINQEGKPDTLQQIRPENGKFTFHGKLEKPQIYFLTLEGGKGRMPLFMEDTVFSIDIRKHDLSDVRNYTTRGGTLQNRKEQLNHKETEIFKDRDSVLVSFYAAEKANDMFTKMHEMAVLQVMGEIYNQEEDKCIADNRDNILGLGLIFYRYRYLNFEQLKPKFDLLSDEMKNTPEGRLIAARYEMLSEVKVGAQALDFKLPTLKGDSIHLYGTSARVKIVDFWASWCGPCRRENPHLVEIYKKYKDKDLLMISVSMDTDEEAWKNAVKTDQLEWTQACDLQGTAGPAARAYRITGIPHIFILDGNNRIVAEGVRGEEIDEVLERLISEPLVR